MARLARFELLLLTLAVFTLQLFHSLLDRDLNPEW
jgi:hypothetical protein